MKIQKKILSTVLLGLSLTLLTALPVFAAKKSSKKKISRATIRVEGKIEVETKIGDENIEISTPVTAEHYSITSADLVEEGVAFYWTANDVPTYKVTLTAEDGYEFNLKKASDLNIIGASYVSGGTEGGRQELVVTIKLPALKDQISPITEATINADGTVTWNESRGAGQYEVKLFKGTSSISGTQRTAATSIDLKEFMQREGLYYAHVRALGLNNPDMAGDWFETPRINLSKEQAQSNKDIYEKANAGTWGQTATGEWYYALSNGTLARSEWRKIKGEWYYFSDTAYMQKGWQELGGKWYYLDPVNGNMWKNTTTPDGYTLGIDGAMATGNTVQK